jgi:hypothetical protein
VVRETWAGVQGEEKHIPKKNSTWAEEWKKNFSQSSPPWLAQGQ